MTSKRNEDKGMSVNEAGQKGGQSNAESHDREHFENIGHKGGQANAETHDREHFENIGQKGGKANAESHDREHFEEIGHKGGQNSGGNFANDRQKSFRSWPERRRA